MVFCRRRSNSGGSAWPAAAVADGVAAGAPAGALRDCENEKAELKTSAAENNSDFETTENLNIYAGLLLLDYLTRAGCLDVQIGKRRFSGQSLGNNQKMRSFFCSEPKVPMLMRVKLKRNWSSVRSGPSALRRYSRLTPQQSQL